jgi:hypothetical protein
VRSAFPLAFLALATSLACGGTPPSDLFGDTPPSEAGADSSTGTPHDGGLEEAPPADAPTAPDDGPVAEAGADGGDDVGAAPDTGDDTGVVVVEAGPPPVTVHCGQSTCTTPEFCCVMNGGQLQACSTSLNDCSNQGGTTVLCTTSTQCADGQVCCGQRPNSNVYQDVSCQPSCGGNNNDRQFCDPNAPNDCPQGTKCQKSQVLSDYFVCL